MKYFRLILASLLVWGLFLGNLLFIELGLYNSYLKADDYFHFLGGVFIALFFIEVFNVFRYFKYSTRDTLMLCLFIFTMTVTVAVFWEFCEYWAERYFGVRLQQGLRDTMHDLMLGSGGGGVVAGIYFFFRKK